MWYGTGFGFAICFIIGCGVIGAFYRVGKNAWAGTGSLWGGIFALIASVIISIMGAALLRVSKLQAKWKLKLAKALEARNAPKDASVKSKFSFWCKKYASSFQSCLESTQYIFGGTYNACALLY